MLSFLVRAAAFVPLVTSASIACQTDQSATDEPCSDVSAYRFDEGDGCFRERSILADACEFLPDNHGSLTSRACFVDEAGRLYIQPSYNYMTELRGQGWKVWLGEQNEYTEGEYSYDSEFAAPGAPPTPAACVDALQVLNDLFETCTEANSNDSCDGLEIVPDAGAVLMPRCED